MSARPRQLSVSSLVANLTTLICCTTSRDQWGVQTQKSATRCQARNASLWGHCARMQASFANSHHATEGKMSPDRLNGNTVLGMKRPWRPDKRPPTLFALAVVKVVWIHSFILSKRFILVRLILDSKGYPGNAVLGKGIHPGWDAGPPSIHNHTFTHTHSQLGASHLSQSCFVFRKGGNQ